MDLKLDNRIENTPSTGFSDGSETCNCAAVIKYVMLPLVLLLFIGLVGLMIFG